MEIQQLVAEFASANLQKSIDFYASLGFKTVDNVSVDGVITWAELSCGSHHIMLQEKGELNCEIPQMADLQIGGTVILVVRCRESDVSNALKEETLMSSVVKPAVKTDYGTYELLLKDPDGYFVMLSGS